MIGERGELCSDIGNPNIASEDECSKMAEMINVTFIVCKHCPFPPEDPRTRRSPPACFFVDQAEIVFWNPAKTGFRNPTSKPICQLAVSGKFIMVYCIILHIFYHVEIPQ